MHFSSAITKHLRNKEQKEEKNTTLKYYLNKDKKIKNKASITK